jgi:hypothetical protein
MKALKLFLIFFLLLFNSLAFGQAGQDFVIRQDIDGSTDQPERRVLIKMVDSVDGYTPKTGLTTTCTVNKPGNSSFGACTNGVTEVGSGWYRVPLGPTEWENLGYGIINLTGTLARPGTAVYRAVESGTEVKEGTTFVKYPYEYASPWTATGVSVGNNTTATYLGFTIADTLTGDGAATTHRVNYSHVKPEGSSLYYFTTEAKSGTLNNAWVGDQNWGTGGDLNTSTGAFTPTTGGLLRGWKVDKLASSWWRIHLLISSSLTDSTALSSTLAIGNGSAGTGAPSFATSGTMIFANAKYARAEDVSSTLLDTVLPNLQSAASTTNVTLDGNETTTASTYNNREICFQFGYASSVYSAVQKLCSCITSYDGTTKVATISPATPSTLTSIYKYKIGGVCLNNPLTVSGAVGSVTATVNANVTTMATDSLSAAAVSAGAAAKIGATVPTDINMGR